MGNRSPWRDKLYHIIFEAETPAGRLFDVVLLWAILLSVIAIILESDNDIGVKYSNALNVIEWAFTIIFLVEYIVRLVTARNSIKYALSFFGIVDLIAIAPTLLSLFFPQAQYFLVVRALRLLRVFRVLKLVRYSQEGLTLLRALRASRAKITVFLGAVVTIVLITGTLMHWVEDGNEGFSSITKSMYWAIVTMTTVGYGDIVPATMTGKFIASIIMIMGYGIIAVPTGIVSVEISNASRELANSIKCSKCDTSKASDSAVFCYRCGKKF